MIVEIGVLVAVKVFMAVSVGVGHLFVARSKYKKTQAELELCKLQISNLKPTSRKLVE
jgi:hypothetical protein